MASSSPPSAITAPDRARRILVEVALAAFAMGGLATLLGLPDRALLVGGAAMAMGACVLIAAASRAPLRSTGLGWPNRVTLLRALLGAVLIGHVLVPERRDAIAMLAMLAVFSDAVDGWLARRLDAASDFGARFDMETDAALLLVICLLLLAQGVCGPWVLAIGLSRYLFVAAMALLPWMDRPLPASERRRAAAGFTMVALVLALFPALPPALALALAAGATAATLASFAVDVCWLARRRVTP